MVLLLFQHIYLPISLWKLTISLRVSWFQSGNCFLTYLMLHFIFGIYQRLICWPPHIPMSALLCLGKSPTSCLGVECFQPSLDISVELCLSSPSLSSPGSVQIPGRTSHRSSQTSYSIAILLNGSSFASHHSTCWQMFLIVKDLTVDVVVSQVLKGRSVIHAFNPLAAQRCVAQTRVLFLSLPGSGRGDQASMTKVYQLCWKEQSGWCA